MTLFDIRTLDTFFDLSTWVTAIVGAVIVLLAVRALTSGRSRGRSRVAVAAPASGSDTPRRQRPLRAQTQICARSGMPGLAEAEPPARRYLMFRHNTDSPSRATHASSATQVAPSSAH
jgi:hypothetical protein